MTTRRIEKSSRSDLLPVLAALLVLCLIIAAVLTALTRNSAPVAAPAEQLSLVVQRMPFEAQNALRGEASAFDALARSMARLKTLAASGARFDHDSGWAAKIPPFSATSRVTVSKPSPLRTPRETSLRTISSASKVIL